MNRWRGVSDLVGDAIDGGSRAIEAIHVQAGAWVFDLLQRVPPLAGPARLARSIQRATIAGTYAAIRLVNRAAVALAAVAIDAAAAGGPSRAAPSAPRASRTPARRRARRGHRAGGRRAPARR
jgi:hypothetical protein